MSTKELYRYTGNRFISYELEESEILAGYQFSNANLKVIQNAIASYAHDIINIEYSASEPHLAALQVAARRGALEALEHLVISNINLLDSQNSDQE